MRPTRGLWQEGHHPEGEGGKGRPRGKGDQRGLRVYMNDVTQQHSGECLGQRTLKGSSLQSYNHKALSYQRPADARLGFMGYAKQRSPKWSNVCLLGPFLR